MGTRVVNLKDFAEELGDYNESRLEQFKEATIHGIARSIPDAVAASPVDTGLYAQSWNFTKTEFGAVFGNTAPHAPIIEYGARPFTPPIKPLLEWSKRVLQDASQPPDYSDRVWALARGVQKKIAREGMKPKGIMEKLIPTIIENIKEEFMRLG